MCEYEKIKELPCNKVIIIPILYNNGMTKFALLYLIYIKYIYSNKIYLGSKYFL